MVIWKRESSSDMANNQCGLEDYSDNEKTQGNFLDFLDKLIRMENSYLHSSSFEENPNTQKIQTILRNPNVLLDS